MTGHGKYSLGCILRFELCAHLGFPSNVTLVLILGYRISLIVSCYLHYGIKIYSRGRSQDHSLRGHGLFMHLE
jgi:hypothetical protein